MQTNPKGDVIVGDFINVPTNKPEIESELRQRIAVFRRTLEILENRLFGGPVHERIMLPQIIKDMAQQVSILNQLTMGLKNAKE